MDISIIVPLFNGALPCEFRKYELFSGRFSDFRESGEQLDKSDRPLKERRPLHLRQAAAEKTDKTEKAEDLGFDNREEERAYLFRRERHNEFDRLKQARERKEQRAQSASAESRRPKGEGQRKEQRPFKGGRKFAGSADRKFPKGNNRGGSFRKNNFNNKKGRS